MFEYNKTCSELLNNLPERTKKIILRRFGLFGGKKETLESIGKEHGITRERVRQIEKDGIKQIKKNLRGHEDVFDFFKKRLDAFGGIKREDLFVEDLIKDDNCCNCVVFLLNACEGIFRIPESDENYVAWAKNKDVLKKVKEVVSDAQKKLKAKKQLLPFSELKVNENFSEEFLASSLEVSKIVVKNEDGLYGLFDWPEISPKGIKDKAYLVFKKAKKPLHFREVASLLGERANPQTTHNELIKDSRFVLVGRGVYALREWGYMPGEVKEVIREILKKQGALHKEEIIIYVEKQRIVKKNTIVQNLSNKKYFIRTPDGKYTVA
jgi:hypothetical protein